MAVDVREKLVELLMQVEDNMCDDCGREPVGCAVVAIADHLIAHGVTVQDVTDISVGSKWISVKDRLPERTGSYIVCTDKGAICTAKFYSDLPTGLRYEKPHWNNSRLNKHITHWCEMPQPPEGG